MPELIEIEEARQLILAQVAPLDPESVPLGLGRGRVLAEGDYATVSKDPRVIEAYIGVGHA